MSTTGNNLSRDIETMKVSINDLWREIAIESDPVKVGALKLVIQKHYVPLLKELVERLEHGPNA